MHKSNSHEVIARSYYDETLPKSTERTLICRSFYHKILVLRIFSHGQICLVTEVCHSKNFKKLKFVFIMKLKFKLVFIMKLKFKLVFVMKLKFKLVFIMKFKFKFVLIMKLKFVFIMKLKCCFEIKTAFPYQPMHAIYSIP